MQNWVVRKPVAASRGGVVAAQNGVAAAVGAEILAAGGSAVDAVVATAFALAVREPWNSGLGGIGFMVVHPPGGGRAEVVDFGPIAPAGLDPAAYPLTGETITELFTWPRVEGDRNMHGPLSFAIPSAVRGYALAVERFGRTPWRDLVAPAVALARQGLPVDWWVTLKSASAAEDLRRYDESRRVWLPDGLPPAAPPNGEPPALSLGRLADTLARLAEYGPDDFYRGEIAAAIAGDVREGGGVLSAEDLALCRARLVPSLEIPYRGYALHAARGLTAAPTLANVLDRLGGKRFPQAPDAVYFETLIDALQQAYHARLEGLGDVEPAGESCTTHITAIDREGGIAALTTTLLSSFGSRYVLPQTGILMNNGVMWFDPRPGHPEFARAGQARADQYVPARRGARRPRPLRGRRLRRTAHPRRGRADGELYRRFRDDPRGGRAPSPDRCQRRERHRDRPAPRRGDPRAARHAPRRGARRAHGLAVALCLPEPRAARRGRHSTTASPT